MGTEPWATGIVPVQNKLMSNAQGESFFAQNLKPFTSYKLLVYSKNLGDLVNHNLSLKITVR